MDKENCIWATLNLLCLDGTVLRMRQLDERFLEVQDWEELRSAESLVKAWVVLLLQRGGLAG